ncbi:MAG: helix-turn-helix domain-containing protein [Verrucomicrobiales bacterium]|nr:AraC family transcriptional regulator [Verrucomicrobiota bacterium JB025]
MERALGEVWVWMNVRGEGMLWGREERYFLRDGMYAILGDDAAGQWNWTRLAGEHEAEVIGIPRAWLARRIGSRSGHLHPDFGRWLEHGGRMSFAGLMTGPERDFARVLGGLSAEDPGVSLRVEGRLLEWAALRLFRQGRGDPGAGFCQRMGGGMVARALRALEAELAVPLNLERLGKECGVSPSHLSRMVKQRTGKTLREHQRRMRIEGACELLREPDARVTEVAFDVGYQSLSHFAKAFRVETGSTPSEWIKKMG